MVRRLIAVLRLRFLSGYHRREKSVTRVATGDSQVRLDYLEACDRVLIFLAFERAGRVNHAPTGLQMDHRPFDHSSLARLESPQIRRVEAPFYFGIAPQRPGARARRVN